MAKYISNRQQNLKIGISSYTENLTVLEVTGGAYVSGNLGIGTTIPTTKLWVDGDGYFTGILTATSFSGNASNATYADNAGIATYADNAGIATYATSSGIATYADNAGIATSVIGGIGSIAQLQVTGISTFTNGPVFVGSATSTGTASQPLQVTGGVYVSGNLGIGTTNPTSKFQVVGDTTLGNVSISSGIISATSGIITYYGDGSNLSIPKFLTIGVRSGTAVTFAIQNNSFNVINRSGLGVTVYTSY